MGVFDETLWKQFETKAKKEDPANGDVYIGAVREICQFGIDRSSMIVRTFPLYTLHNEQHIVNVIQNMACLLGNHMDKLNQHELAMLLAAACCHDVGMSYSDQERSAELADGSRVKEYLAQHPSHHATLLEQTDIVFLRNSVPRLDKTMEEDYLRSIHHLRVSKLLPNKPSAERKGWPSILTGKLNREDVIAVCQSHGRNLSAVKELKCKPHADLRLCGILLRLADILDFNASRAPQAIYEYHCFEGRQDAASKYSQAEWEKHQQSGGFDFASMDLSQNDFLPYSAVCTSMEGEKKIRSYLDWADAELLQCNEALESLKKEHQTLLLPKKVLRDITSNGYLSGEYRLTLDQGQVMELLVGENLYSDPGVFVRELLQNAIDAVRTRKHWDGNLPDGWNPPIRIRCWTDISGYQWFRIEDEGIGMTEDVIRNYFLKVGCSYYNSDEFRLARLKKKRGSDFTPISRFGIGILSCFMGDSKSNLLEVSTRHYDEGEETHAGLRLKMEGLRGYYYMAKEDMDHEPGPMAGEGDAETQPYLPHAGTVVAVRTNLYQSGSVHGFKEILDRYVLYPEVPVHYDGPEGHWEYPTEQELLQDIRNIPNLPGFNEEGVREFPVPDEKLDKVLAEIQKDWPGLVFTEKPVLKLKCAPLSLPQSKYLSGAILTAGTCGRTNSIPLQINGTEYNMYLTARSFYDIENHQVDIQFMINRDSNNPYRETSFDLYCDEHNKNRVWRVTVVNFEDYSWYQKYLKPLVTNEKTNICGHNGVFCGLTERVLLYSRTPLISILLLKDQYRPKVELSRDNIKQLPLEAICELAVLDAHMETQHFITGAFEDIVDYNLDFHRPTDEYSDVISRYPSLIGQLLLLTGQKQCAVSTLDELLRNEETVSFDNCLCLSYHANFGSEIKWHYSKLLSSYLLSKYSVKFETFNKVIIQKAADKNLKTGKFFPPVLFLEPLREILTLTCSDALDRKTCNARHPLSQFLIRNAEQLQQRVPGLFRKVLYSLMNDDQDEMIASINEVLERLKHVPNLNIQIPADLKLTEDDFEGIPERDSDE